MLFFVIDMKYAVMLCYWNNQNVIKDAEDIEAKNLNSAFEKTDRNLEMNVVIPINHHTGRMIKKLINLFPKKMTRLCYSRINQNNKNVS